MGVSTGDCPRCNEEFSGCDDPQASLRAHLIFNDDSKHDGVGELITELTEMGEETKEKISETLTGRSHTEETRQKMSESQPNNKIPGSDLGQDFAVEPRTGCPVCGASFSDRANPFQSLRMHISGSRDEEHNTDRIRELQSLLSKSKNLPDETQRKLSETRQEQENPMQGKSHSEATKEQIGESQPDTRSDHPATGEHPDYCTCASCTNKGGNCEWYDIGLSSKVQGTWERDVGLKLIEQFGEQNVEAQVEFNYKVDFVIRDSIAVEVKGYVKEEDPVKAETFIEENSEMQYVVVCGEVARGSLPCDKELDVEEVIENGM